MGFVIGADVESDGVTVNCAVRSWVLPRPGRRGFPYTPVVKGYSLESLQKALRHYLPPSQSKHGYTPCGARTYDVF